MKWSASGFTGTAYGYAVLVSQPVEEQLRKTARGKNEATPARALAGVTVTVGVVAGVLIAVLVLLWWLIAR